MGPCCGERFERVYSSAFPDAPPVGKPEPLILPCSAALEICRDRSGLRIRNGFLASIFSLPRNFLENFPGVRITIQLRITGDKIEDAAIYSDALIRKQFFALAKCFTAVLFTGKHLKL